MAKQCLKAIAHLLRNVEPVSYLGSMPSCYLAPHRDIALVVEGC